MEDGLKVEDVVKGDGVKGEGARGKEAGRKRAAKVTRGEAA